MIVRKNTPTMVYAKRIYHKIYARFKSIVNPVINYA